MARDPAPPYTSVGDVDAFFERVERIAEPKPQKKVDTDWVKNYGFDTAHPSAIPSMLKWLGVINDEGESTGVWDKLRVGSSRQTSLEPLVRGSYKGIFDAVEVESATRADLRGAFVSAYSVGDSTRHINCFLALCRHAGIKTADEPKSRESKAKQQSGEAKARRATDSQRPAATKERPRAARQHRTAAGISVTLNVEIPAEWTEEQIRERIAAVTRAVESAGAGDS